MFTRKSLWCCQTIKSKISKIWFYQTQTLVAERLNIQYIRLDKKFFHLFQMCSIKR